MDSRTETPSSITIDDPAGVCMLLMAHGMFPLAAHTARQVLRSQGAYAPEPEQAAKVRSRRYAIMGGKPS